MPLTIREIAETGQERACYIASGGGGREGGRREKGEEKGEGKGRVDVIVSFFSGVWVEGRNWEGWGGRGGGLE